MEINQHLLVDAEQHPSPNYSGSITPKFIVMHYTAANTLASTIKTFSNTQSKVSAHLTIGRKATIAQHVPFNKKAWHAGPSSYKGYSGLNRYSIGIEMVNLGYLREVKGAEHTYVDAYGTTHDDLPVIRADSPRVGSGAVYWPLYPEVQLLAAVEAVEAILKEYPSIIDIVTHEEIDTRGWKTDPGPAFPMSRFKALLKGREKEELQYKVTASVLNGRGGPSTQFKILKKYSKNNTVTVTGTSGKWFKTSDDVWIHSGYVRVV